MFHKTRPSHLFGRHKDYLTWNARFAGKKLATRTADRYIRTTVCGAILLGHRAAWVCMTGDWPKWSVDHINGNGSDNRWCNLRDVPQAINMQNVTSRAKDSGLSIGVTLSNNERLACRYRASIQAAGKKIALGYFETADEAAAAYRAAKMQLHGISMPE